MSTSIDRRVVQMRFDNADFERKANSTIRVLERLKEKTKLKGTSDAIAQVQKEVNNLNFNQFSKSADSLSDVLSTKVIAKLEIMHNLVGRVTDAGVNMIKSLSVDQVSSGFSKYEQKLANTQAIMNATKQPLSEVNKQLDKLMWYTDETSYSFSDMANTIGRFTAYNIPLDKSVTSIIGIANAAGLAGASIQDASHAMQGFAKGIGSAMDTADWQWIETAHMDTAEFKTQLMEAASELGVLKKVGDGTYKTMKGTLVNIESFRSSISEKWITGDVLTTTLSKFGEYSEEVYKLTQQGMSTADAMDYLSGKFDEVGEAGMRASQESKTFGDAISAVKDAISSGWMVTFETLFGNFEEAKEVWATLYDELYDLFALSGETRNELLSEWKDAGGRDTLFEAIGEGWTKIKDVMAIAKDAMHEVIPPTTVQDLVNLTNAFRDFVGQFKLSEDAAYSLKVILKTLLLPLKLLTIGVKAAANGIRVFIGFAVNLTDLLLTMAHNSEVARNVFKNIFGEENGERIFNAMNTIVENTITTIGNLITKFNELKDSIFNSGDMSGGFMKLLNDFGEGFSDFLADALEAASVGDWDKFFDAVLDGLANLGKGAADAGKFVGDLIRQFLEFAGIKLPEFEFDNLSDFIDKVKEFIKELNPFKEGIDGINESGTDLLDVLQKIGKAMMDFVNSLSPAEIILSGVGIAIVTLIFQISNWVGAAAEVTKGFTSVTKSAGAMFNAIKNRLDPTFKSLKTAGDTAVKIGASFILLATALTAISKIDPERLKGATQSLALLIGIIAGVAVAMNILNIVASKLKVDNKGLGNFGTTMLGLSAALLAVAGALRLMDDLEVNWKALIGIVTGMLAITAAAGYLGKQKNKFDKGARVILAMAASFLLITIAINKIDPTKLGAGLIALAGTVGSMTLLLLASSKAGEHSSKAIKATTKLSTAMLLMIGVIELLGFLLDKHPERFVTGIMGLVTVMGAMTVLMLATRIFGKYMDDATRGLQRVAMSAALLILPVYVFGKMDEGILKRGTGVIMSLIGFYALISTVLGIVQKKGKIKGGSFSKNLWQLSMSITILVLAVAALGYLDTGAVTQGVIAVGFLSLFIGLIVGLAKTAKKATIAMTGIAAAIAAFAIAVAGLSFIAKYNFEGFWSALLGMFIGLMGLAVVINQLSKEFKPTALVPIIGLVVGLGGLMAILFLNTRNMDGDEAIKKLGGMALVMTAMAAVASALNDPGKEGKVNWPLAMKQIVQMAAFAAIAGIAVGVLGNFGGDNSEKVLVNATALSGVMLTMAGVARIMQGAKFDGNLVQSGIFLAEFIGVTSIAILALGNFGGDDPTKVLANSLALSSILISVSAAVKIMNGTKWDKDLTEKAGWMVTFIGVATGAVWILGNFGGADPAQVLANAGALSAILLSTAVAVKIMNNTNFEMGAAQAVTLSLLVAGISAAMLILAEIKTDGMIEKAAALVVILAGVVAAAMVLGKFGKGTTGGVQEGVKACLVVVAGIALVVVAIGGIAYLLGQLEVEAKKIEDGFGVIEKVMSGIGNAIGSLFGGIANGYNNAATEDAEAIAQRISGFIDTIGTSLDTIKQFDDNLKVNFANFKTCMDQLLSITSAAQVTDGSALANLGTDLLKFSVPLVGFCSVITDFVTEDTVASINGLHTLVEAITMIPSNPKKLPDLQAFMDQANAVAPDIVSFSEKLSEANIDSAAIESTTNAAKSVASFAQELSQNGVFSACNLYSAESGDGLLARFGKELESFGPSFRSFAIQMTGLSTDAVTNGIEAAKVVASFAKELPAEGGVVQWWTGNPKTLSSFAEEMDAFAPSFVSFANTLSGVTDWSSVENASKAATTVADFANELPSTGGTLQEWIGEKKTLSAFGAELEAFGPKFKKYADDVSGISKDDVTGATEAVKDVITLYSELPTSGGWIEAIFGGAEMDLATFGASMSSLGWSIKLYNDYVKDISNISPSVDAIQLVIDLSNNLGDFKKDNIDKFKNGIESFANTGVDRFLDKISDSRETLVKGGAIFVANFIDGVMTKETDLSNAGFKCIGFIAVAIEQGANSAALKNAGKKVANEIGKTISDEQLFNNSGKSIIDRVIKGIQDKTSELKVKIKTVLEDALKVFNDVNKNNTAYSNTYFEVGLKTIDGYITGMKSREPNLKKGIESAIKIIGDGFKKSEKDAKKFGSNLINGVIKGIKATTPALTKAGANAAVAVINAMRKSTKTNSPSKLSEEKVGVPIDQGVAVGITKSKASTNAAYDKGIEVVKEFQNGYTKTIKYYHNSAPAIEDLIGSDKTDFRKQGEEDAREYLKGTNLAIKNSQPINASNIFMDGMGQTIKTVSTPDYAKGVMALIGFSKGLKEAAKATPFTVTADVTSRINDAKSFISGKDLLEEFSDQFDQLSGLNTIHTQAYKQAKDKIASLEKLIETQTDVVTGAEKNYLSALEKYGFSADETANSFNDWALQTEKLKEYQNEAEKTRQIINNDGKKNYAQAAANFLEANAETIEKLKQAVGNGTSDVLEMITALQADIADGIINDPKIEAAIQEKVSKILDIFAELTDELDLGYEIDDKEYQLWLKTAGRDASEAEKLAKKQELLEKQLSADAEKVMVAETAYRKAVEIYGASSTKAQEYYSQLLDAQNEFADHGSEYAKVLDEVSKAENKAAEESSKAAEKQAKAADKAKTAKELALEEYEEWKKDGSLKEWHDFGATDEELMQKLIEKYEKQKKEQEAIDAEQKVQEEEDKEYEASGSQMLDIMNKFLGGVNQSVIDARVNDRTAELLTQWGQELNDSITDMSYSVAESTTAGGEAIADATIEAVRVTLTPDKAWVKYINDNTGEIYEAYMNREEMFRMIALQSQGWRKVSEDWDRQGNELRLKSGWTYGNTKGTLEASKSPFRKAQIADLRKKLGDRAKDSYTYQEAMNLTKAFGLEIPQWATQNTIGDGLVGLTNPKTGEFIFVLEDQLDTMIKKGWTYAEDGKRYNWISEASQEAFSKGDFGHIGEYESSDYYPGDYYFENLAKNFLGQDANGNTVYQDALQENVAASTQQGFTQGVSQGVGQALQELGYGTTPSNLGLDVPGLGTAGKDVVGDVAQEIAGQMGYGDALKAYREGGFAGLLDYGVDQAGTGAANWGNQTTEGANKILDGMGNFFDKLQGKTTEGIQETGEVSTEGVRKVLYVLGREAQNGGNKAGTAGAEAMANGFVEHSTSTIVMQRYGAAPKPLANAFMDGMVEGIEARFPDVQAAIQRAVEMYEAAVAGMGASSRTVPGAGSAIYTVGGAPTEDKPASYWRNQITEWGPKPVVEMGDNDTKTIGVTIGGTIKKAIETSRETVERLFANAIRGNSSQSPTPSQTINNFTQNNYSPRALSRYDIYRDTRNQLSRMRG